MNANALAQARITGAFWMLCVIGGIYGYFPGKGTPLGKDAILIAGASYVIVTILLYALLKPVNPIVALLSAAFGLVGIATSGDGSFYFGIQCILIGYLVLNATFLPRVLGALMVIAGLGQIIVLSTLLPAAVTARIAPAGFISDGIGEIALALWLLFMGINLPRWQKAAAGA